MDNKKEIMSEEELLQTIEVLKDSLDLNFEMNKSPFDVKKFAQGIQQGAFTPSLQNQLMKSVNINTQVPNKDKIEEALKNPSDNENNLVSYSQSYYFDSLMYKRNHEYLANLPAFDLEMTCINAKPDDYKSKKYLNDYEEVKNFFDKFNYREQFKSITWNLLMEETYYGIFREFDTKSLIQSWPWKYAQITGKFEYGFLYDIDMGYFLQPQVDINLYPDWFKKKYLEIFDKGKGKKYIPSNKTNKRTGTFATWTQTDPDNGFFCFKFNSNHSLQVPFFSAMLPEMAIVPIMRNLQVSQSMAAARKLLVSSVPYLKDKKSSDVANALAIDADILGKFIGMATVGLEAAIKVFALPTEDIKGVEFENTDKDTYKNFMAITSSLLSGGKVIFSTNENQNLFESKLSLDLDRKLVESIYPQFENFLEYYVNKKTKKFKWKFKFVGSSDEFDRERRQKEVISFAEKGVVLPNKIASSMGLNKIELERELEEAKYTEFTGKLMEMINLNTMSSKSEGRPIKNDNDLSNSGAETRAKGSNLEK